MSTRKTPLTRALVVVRTRPDGSSTRHEVARTAAPDRDALAGAVADDPALHEVRHGEIVEVTVDEIVARPVEVLAMLRPAGPRTAEDPSSWHDEVAARRRLHLVLLDADECTDEWAVVPLSHVAETSYSDAGGSMVSGAGSQALLLVAPSLALPVTQGDSTGPTGALTWPSGRRGCAELVVGWIQRVETETAAALFLEPLDTTHLSTEEAAEWEELLFGGWQQPAPGVAARAAGHDTTWVHHGRYMEEMRARGVF